MTRAASISRLTRLGAFVMIVYVLAVLSEGTLRADVSAAQEAASLFQSVMSPFCPGLTLATCPSSSAVSLRAEILERLRRGESREAIVHDLLETYDDRIRGTPVPSGLALLLWIVPGVIGSALVLALVLAGRGLVPTESRSPPHVSPASSDLALEQRLADQLRQLD